MNTEKIFKPFRLISYKFFTIIIVIICSQGLEAQEEKKHYLKQVKNAFLFANIGGSLHGIAFDNQNSMYVGKNGKEILKVSPEGKISPFVVIKEASGHYIDGPGDTFIYDMEFGKDRHLYVAAEDRILKISQTGQIEILLKENFKGTWGACGIELDTKGNIYVAFDNKILKILPTGQKSIFIDGNNTDFKLEAVVGLEFDATYKYLYVCDGIRGKTGKLIRIPIRANGSSGEAKIIFKKKGYRPEYVSIDDKNNLVIKGPENSNFVLLKSSLTPIIIEGKNLGYVEIETIAFGKKGFKENAIYGTEWFNGKIYRIDF